MKIFSLAEYPNVGSTKCFLFIFAKEKFPLGNTSNKSIFPSDGFVRTLFENERECNFCEVY